MRDFCGHMNEWLIESSKHLGVLAAAVTNANALPAHAPAPDLENTTRLGEAVEAGWWRVVQARDIPLRTEVTIALRG